jgi:hypothetical protein
LFSDSEMGSTTVKRDRGRSELRTAGFVFLSDRASGWGFAVLAVVSLVASAPSSTFAQTLNLGQAGNDGLFAVYNSNTGGGDFNFSNSVDVGGATLGASSYIGGSGTIVGNLIADPTAANGGVTVLGTSNYNLGTYIAGLGQTAINTATTAQSWSTSGANVLSPTVSGNNYTFSGSSSNSGNNVITINGTTNAGLLNLNTAGSSYTITLTGTSTEQFVFNITGRLTWTNVTVILNGVSASNVFYNFISGNDGINSSNLSGTVMNVINGTSMSIDNSVINGAVVSDGFVDLSNSVIAPELPTIMMAGITCLFLLGKVGLDCRRRLTGLTRA